MSTVKYSDGGRAAAGMYDRNDCAVRAYAHFTGCSYPVAHGIFAAQGRKVGRGTPLSVIKDEMDKLGAVLKTDIGTVGKLVKSFPKGNVYALIKKHAFAVVDGVLLDSVHVGEKQRVKGYYIMPDTKVATKTRKPRMKSPAGTKAAAMDIYEELGLVSLYAKAKAISEKLGISIGAANYYVRSFAGKV